MPKCPWATLNCSRCVYLGVNLCECQIETSACLNLYQLVNKNCIKHFESSSRERSCCVRTSLVTFYHLPLGYVGTGESHNRCSAVKSEAAVWCYHVNMKQNLWGMHLVESMPRRRQFWRQKGGSNPLLARHTQKLHMIHLNFVYHF